MFWLAGCPARFKFKASRMRMGGPNTERLPEGSHGQGLAAGSLLAVGLRGLHPFPAGLCVGSHPPGPGACGQERGWPGGSWLHTECVLVLLQGR